jgi:hypothetical protein
LTLVAEGNRALSAKIQKDGSFSFSAVQGGTYKPGAHIPPSRTYVQRISATVQEFRGTKSLSTEPMMRS